MIFVKGPGRISLSHAPFDSDSPLDDGQFFSDGKSKLELQIASCLSRALMINPHALLFYWKNLDIMRMDNLGSD